MKMPHPQESWAHRVLGDFNFEKQRGFLACYYRLTCPPNPRETATFQQREVILRCKRAAAIMLFLALVMVLVAGIAWAGPNKAIWNVVIEQYLAIAVCIFLNRRGWVNLVGVLLIVGINGGMYATLITTAYFHGGLSLIDEQIFLIVFYGELVAAILLPFWSCLLVMLLNLSLSAYLLACAPHAEIPGSFFATFFRLGQEHILIPGLMWIIVTQFRHAIARANQGETIAKLTRQLGEEQARRAQQGEALAQSIAHMSGVLAAMANGNLAVRLPLTGANVLYQIAGPINHLLERHKRLSQEYQEAKVRAWLLHEIMEEHPEMKALVAQRLRERREHELLTQQDRPQEPHIQEIHHSGTLKRSHSF